MAEALFYMVVFPGFLFLGLMGLAFEFVDRRLYARFQNRQGPPWFQPFADFIKLAAKEDIVPAEANRFVFKAMPILALTAVVSAILYIPVFGTKAVFSFQGDLVVVIYLLTIPTLAFFLGGWYSTSLYAMIGSMRVLTQLFAYEVPLFLAVLSPAVLAGTWSLSGMAGFYTNHPLLVFVNILGFLVSIIALQGKLERVPFDIPEAETEIVGGTFTEYSGRLLALFRMTIDTELIVGGALISAVFLPWGLELGAVVATILFIVKIAVIVFLSALIRSIVARLRIEQMVDFCWKYVAPAAIVQLLVSLIVGALIAR